jgi:methylmalonyl-CoA mutase, C-terminal domain
VLDALRKAGAADIPVMGGGVIPDEDIPNLKEKGIRAVFTPGTPIVEILDAFREAVAEHRRVHT